VGPSGFSGYQIVNGSAIPIPPGGAISAGISCPAGKKILSGGVDTSSTLDATISRSVASSDTSWNIGVRNEGSSTISVTLQAVCAFAN